MGGDIKRDEYEDDGLLIETDCNGELMEATELSEEVADCDELEQLDCWLLLLVRWIWVL